LTANCTAFTRVIDAQKLLDRTDIAHRSKAVNDSVQSNKCGLLPHDFNPHLGVQRKDGDLD